MNLPDDLRTRLLDALDGCGLLVALFDPDDVLRHANATYRATFLPDVALPLAFGDVLRHGHRHGIGVRISSGDVEAFLSDILSRRRSLPIRSVTTDLVDGRWIMFTETLRDDGWMLTVGTDISTLKQTEADISRRHQQAVLASQTDGLTGLSNRNRVLQLAQAALDHATATTTPVSLALIDLDHFKSVNDQHGHLEGDRVLRAFAEVCRHKLRPDDAFGRMGGEEFLLVMRGLSAARGYAVMQRLRRDLARSWDDAREPIRGVTFSCGITQARPGETLDEALQRADEALYAAKRAGRDRCVSGG
ncbi:GGDEF domain-containing protein [Sphaerotilus mobilis]|uniref:diguanylate cyclase n=1 Tax=Sphaerotilus mobilis TaxID=47994 RepID=A0A4Q7LWR7_9BURK|nr:sensor domain-containing diguanylate cyclase [Sphaerotilus mobilis]RZS58588.1 diguanylate cyclase (GGDEF)-like protein [Sphaerotilus mobilis]